MLNLRTALGLALLAALAALLYRRNAESLAAEAAVPDARTRSAAAMNEREPSGSSVPQLHPRSLADLLEDGHAADPPPTPLAQSSELLPAWDARLVEVLPALRARADAGDVVASCHLGLALSACALHFAAEPSPALLRQIDPSDDEALTKLAWRSSDLRRPGRERACVGLSKAELDLRVPYLERAADAGHAAAMLAYADGAHLQMMEDWVRHPEQLERYGERAPRFIARLIRRGDRSTAFLLAFGNSGLRSSPLAQALKLDESTAAMFWHLNRLVMARPEDGFRVHPEAIDAPARAKAQALHLRYFDQRPMPTEELRRRLDLWRVENCVEAR
jgi:hypothetical protein